MVKVRMRTLMAGPGRTVQPGEEVSFDDATAQVLVAAGAAVLVDKPVQPVPEVKEREAAVVEPEEQAVQPRPKGKKRRRKS